MNMMDHIHHAVMTKSETNTVSMRLTAASIEANKDVSYMDLVLYSKLLTRLHHAVLFTHTQLWNKKQFSRH